MEDLLQELVEKILLDTDYLDVINYSMTNSNINNICQSEYFWQRKLDIDYPSIRQYKPSNLTYQQQYKSLYNLRSFVKAISNGRLDQLVLFYNKGEIPEDSDFDVLVEYGYIHILDWYAENGILPGVGVYYSAVVNGHFEILDWLYDHDIKINNEKDDYMHQIIDGIMELTKDYYREFILWLESHEIPIDQQITNSAVYSNSLSLLQWLQKERGFLPDDVGANNAARIANIEILEWLLSQNILPDILMEYKEDSMELMEWFFKHKLVPNDYEARHLIEHIYYQSLINFRFDILEELYNEAFDIPTCVAFDGVVVELQEALIDKDRGSSVRIFQWLEAHGVEMNTRTANEASCYDKPLLIWLENRGILPDDDGIIKAVHTGSIEVLEWLESRGILPNNETLDYAASKGGIEVLEWLESRGILFNIETANYAASDENIQVLEWLEVRGILPTIETANNLCAMSCYHLKTLEWLISRNIIPNQKGIQNAGDCLPM